METKTKERSFLDYDKTKSLTFKIGISRDTLTLRSGFALYSEFMRAYGIKGLIDRLMPELCSNRVLAYNVFIMKKYFVLPEAFGTKTIQSIRWMLIEIAGKVVRHAGGLCTQTPNKNISLIF